MPASMELVGRDYDETITNKICQKRHLQLTSFFSGILEREILKELLRINNLKGPKKSGYVQPF